jgi:KipI family sensor histidine kinase inhibitor
MTVPTVLPYGPAAVLVELPDPTWVAAMAELLVDRPGISEIVPAECTVLVRLDPEQFTPASFCSWVQDASVTQRLVRLREPVGSSPIHGDSRAAVVEIPVVYDGEDLQDVATLTGLSVGEVIDRHSAAVYRAAFAGFAPGFVYLRGLPDALQLPRRARPRTRVPGGSVAIAAGYSAVYPSDQAGGWHLIGRTSSILWDLTREPPLLITPGDVVRFVPRTRFESP